MLKEGQVESVEEKNKTSHNNTALLGSKTQKTAEAWDVFQCLSHLKLASQETIKETTSLIEAKEAQIRVMRTNIIATSKLNFERERQLDEVDKRIKLLVKNRIKVEEATQALSSDSNKLTAENNSSGEEKESFFQQKRLHYELLFRYLQSHPHYLAKMTKIVEAKSVPLFVQTIVFDMYGDQYEDRDERLLLLCFRDCLKEEVLNATTRGSLFRANTAITQMLSAYARRGQGLSVLRSVLEEPLKSLTSRKDLNLEINPQKIYQQLIQDSERETGQVWAEERSVSDEVAAKHPVVKKIVEQHCSELIKVTDYILTRIIENIDKIPFGMRWICKQLSDLCRARFVDVDRYQVGSLIGGYIYLRFFNPVIVTPDALNFIQIKPSRVMRRNLILIAKILQNLSNGIDFGDKEQYMRFVNPFIQARKDSIQCYFEKLADVDDLDDSWEIDKFKEHMVHKPLNLLLSQIFLCHNILWQNMNQICPENSSNNGSSSSSTTTVSNSSNEGGGSSSENAELRKYLLALGPAKTFPEDRLAVLHMVNANKNIAWGKGEHEEAKNDNNDEEDQKEQVVLINRAKELFLSVAISLPTKSLEAAKEIVGDRESDLIEYFSRQQKEALSNGEESLAIQLAELGSVLTTLNEKKSANTGGKTFSLVELLSNYSKEVKNGHEKLKHLTKRLDLIQSADQSISAHHTYLESRLDLYRMYLENVKKGGTTLKEQKKKKEEKKSTSKFSLQTLLDENVVTKVGNEIPKKFYKKVYFRFTETSPTIFKVEVTIKEGIELNVLEKPLEIALDELLRKQDANEDILNFEPVALNVNILIRFLNQHFVQQV